MPGAIPFKRTAKCWSITLAASIAWVGLASEAAAVAFQYGITGGELIFSSSAFGPQVDFTLDAETCPWIGPSSSLVIDDDGTGSPVLASFVLQIQCTFTRTSSDSTAQPGSSVNIQIDMTFFLTGPIEGVGAAVPGGTIDFPPLPLAKTGQGILCNETVPGGCVVAGLTPGVWGPGPAIDPTSDLGDFVFSANGQEITIDACPNTFPGPYSCVNLKAGF